MDGYALDPIPELLAEAADARLVVSIRGAPARPPDSPINRRMHRKPVQPDQRIEQGLELVEFCACFLGRASNHGTQCRQDLQVLWSAVMLAHATFDIGVEGLAGGLGAIDGVDDVRVGRGQFAALIGSASLDHDGMALRRLATFNGPRTLKYLPRWLSTCILASS